MADIVHETSARHDTRRDYRTRDEEVTVLGAVLKRTSWGAVIAGTVVAISVQMILTVLGIAVGVTSGDVVGGADHVHEGIKTAAAIWWLASGTLSLFIGGCVVGSFAGMTRSPDVLLHGLTMWSVTAVFGFLVVTAGAGALYGTAMNATYVGTQSARGTQNAEGKNALRVGSSTDAADSASKAPEIVVTPEEAQRYVSAASWWTLLGLLLGIAAALGGSWVTAPELIAVRPTSQGAPVAHLSRA